MCWLLTLVSFWRLTGTYVHKVWIANQQCLNFGIFIVWLLCGTTNFFENPTSLGANLVGNWGHVNIYAYSHNPGWIPGCALYEVNPEIGRILSGDDLIRINPIGTQWWSGGGRPSVDPIGGITRQVVRDEPGAEPGSWPALGGRRSGRPVTCSRYKALTFWV